MPERKRFLFLGGVPQWTEWKPNWTPPRRLVRIKKVITNYLVNYLEPDLRQLRNGLRNLSIIRNLFGLEFVKVFKISQFMHFYWFKDFALCKRFDIDWQACTADTCMWDGWSRPRVETWRESQPGLWLEPGHRMMLLVWWWWSRSMAMSWWWRWWDLWLILGGVVPWRGKEGWHWGLFTSRCLIHSDDNGDDDDYDGYGRNERNDDDDTIGQFNGEWGRHIWYPWTPCF